MSEGSERGRWRELLRRLASPAVRLWGWVSARASRLVRPITPGPRAWRGATLGLLVGVLFLFMAHTWSLREQTRGDLGFVYVSLIVLAVTLLLAPVASLALFLLRWLRRVVGNPPLIFLWLLVSAYLSVRPFLWALDGRVGMLKAAALYALTWSLLGAGVFVLLGQKRARSSALRRGTAVTGLAVAALLAIVGLRWLYSDGSFEEDEVLAGERARPTVPSISLPNPGLPGPHEFATLTYGSGKDIRRQEYAEGADLITESVDGSPYVDGWKGFTGWSYTRFWGFDVEELPVQGRVWYPVTDEPSPLVLVVHGNHSMSEYSDPGYAYLGEHLASRGFILTSVDENFLNLSHATRSEVISGGGLKDEIDGRGWMLLQHLKVWREWNEDPESPFFGRVDLDRVALIGHSRGGEAVTVAAAFNRLSAYPDDALETFDFGFGIRSVVAFAPVDSSYRPRGDAVPLENINYLVLHGAHDSDVSSYLGARMMERIEFTDGEWWIKAGFYIDRANHGQFNTVWGNRDWVGLGAETLNVASLIPLEDQLTIARVVIGGFLEATLNGKDEYVALLKDPAAAGDWLPPTRYVTHVRESGDEYVATYEEDIDVLSTTLEGGRHVAENLTVWREELVGMKWRDLETTAGGPRLVPARGGELHDRAPRGPRPRRCRPQPDLLRRSTRRECRARR